MRVEALSGWTSDQKHVVAATFLGWTLDAFDFFLLVFVLKDIAAEFHSDITEVTFAILLTLAMRPLGAYLFGRAADRWGRRPTLMVDVLLYSAIDDARGTFPGFVYQLGNLIASVNATLQAAIATHYGGNYALALALVAGIVAVIIVILAALGSEAKGVAFGNSAMLAAAAASAAR
jgi:MFS family permease